MSRRERIWLVNLALLLVMVTTIPYLIGVASESQDWVFSGHLIGVEDGHSYLAKMLRGNVGDWLFRTPYSLIEQRGVAVFIPYLVLGKLFPGRAQHDQLVVAFHLLRSIGVVVAVYGTYRFAAHFVEDHGSRRWVTVMGTVGGGLGWLLLLGDWGLIWPEVPLVFLSPETFGFLGLFGVPHLALSRGLFMLTLAGYLEALEGARSWRPAALFLLLTALVHPLTGLIGIAVIAAHQWALLGSASAKGQWEAWRGGAAMTLGVLAPAAPYLLYLVVRSQADPFLQGWAMQNRIASPHLGYYILAYGLLLPMAAFGARALIHEGRRDGLLPVAWVVLLPALIYAPVTVQRRLAEGGWVALATLAAYGVLQVNLRPWRRGLRTTMLALALPGSLILLLGAARLARAPARPAFLPGELVDSYRWIAEQAAVDAVVMASAETGNSLPAWAPVRVPVGHGPESVPYDSALSSVKDYYGARSEAERGEIINELGVDFVFFGPDERKLADEPFDPGERLERVSTQGEFTIYRVRGAGP